METDEIIRLKCHRVATEDELLMAELIAKRPVTASRGRPPTADSSPHHSAAPTPNAGVQFQDAHHSGSATPKRAVFIQDAQSSDSPRHDAHASHLSGASTPRAAVQVQSPVNPHPIGSAQSRPVSGIGSLFKPDMETTAHCTSLYLFVTELWFWFVFGLDRAPK